MYQSNKFKIHYFWITILFQRFNKITTNNLFILNSNCWLTDSKFSWSCLSTKHLVISIFIDELGARNGSWTNCIHAFHYWQVLRLSDVNYDLSLIVLNVDRTWTITAVATHDFEFGKYFETWTCHITFKLGIILIT